MVRTPVAAALALLLASIHPASAQDWPARTLTMVVPFPAGGPIDVVGRILAPPMAEFSAGSSSTSAAPAAASSSRVAKAAPGGYQFLIGNSGTHTYSQLLTKKPPYDAVADFTPVAVFVENSKVLTAKDLPADTLPEFIAYAKANQAKMQYGSAGAGSATHMTCVLLNAAIGVDVTHVPYRGTGPAMQDLMGGRIDYICDVISTALPLIRSQSIKPIALLSPRRNAVLPGLATADEQGLTGFDADAWNAFFLPRGTPSRSCAALRRRRAARWICLGCASGSRASASMSRRRSGARRNISSSFCRASSRSGRPRSRRAARAPAIEQVKWRERSLLRLQPCWLSRARPQRRTGQRGPSPWSFRSPPAKPPTCSGVLAQRIGSSSGSRSWWRTSRWRRRSDEREPVAKAAPDGHQALLGNIATHAYSQTLYKKPPYDAAGDFAPVGLVAGGLWVLVARNDLPVITLSEFVAYAKANQARMQYGSAGVGSGTHITCVLLNMAMGTSITHVPYRGSGPAMQDLVAGASTSCAT